MQYIKKYGFYIALALGLLLLGGGAYYIRERPAPIAPAPAPVPAAAAPESVDRLQEVEKEALPDLLWPVTGHEILNGHSPNALIWSETLSQWQTHDGVDILCVKGEVARAALNGTVARAGRDPLLGFLVELRHGDGIVTRYGSLSTAALVEVGQEVKRGDPIGAISDSAPAESALPPHLHYEAWKGEEWIGGDNGT